MGSTNQHIKVGKSNALFTNRKSALNAFGYTKGHYPKTIWGIPHNVARNIGLPEKCAVWFPKLFEHALWENKISEDGSLIYQIHKDPHYIEDEKWDKRVVMTHLENGYYEFIGVFEVIQEYRSGRELRFQRVSNFVRTYAT